MPELPWTMPGNRRPMLGADDEHVAAVAIGDDLLLEVLRRFLAAQVRLERAAQPRPLLAQTVPNAPQLRARIVHHLAAGIDLLADLGDLSLEGCGGVGDPAQVRNGAARTADARCGALDRAEERRQRQQVQRLERAPFDRDRAKDLLEVRRRLQGDLTVARGSGPSRRSRIARARPRAGRPRARAAPAMLRPSASARIAPTAATIRSNSRARRAPGCMVNQGCENDRQGNRSL